MRTNSTRVLVGGLVSALLTSSAMLSAPTPAEAAAPAILTNGTNWIVDATSPHSPTDTLNVALVARHDPGRRIVGIVSDTDGVDNTATLAPAGVNPEYMGAPGGNRLASTVVRTNIVPNFVPPTSCDPFGGTRRDDSTVFLSLVDDLGQRSDPVSFNWHVIANSECVGATDFPVLLATSSSTSAAGPGQSVFFGFTCNDSDVTGTGDRCDFVQARWRRINDGFTQALGNFDAEDNVSRSYVAGAPADRGLWVIEAQLFTEDGLEDAAFWRIATVEVNHTTPPTGALSFSGAGVVPGSGGAPASVNAGDAATAVMNVVSSGPSPNDRVQVIEWDATGDGTFERTEYTTPYVAGTTITHDPLSAAQLAQAMGTSTPGVYTVVARLTDNGSIDAADQLRRTSAPIGAQLRVNARPLATGGSATTAEDTPVDITLAGSDPDNQPAALRYELATAPAHGTVTLAGNVATYVPAPDYVGPDSFTFRTADGPAGAAWAFSSPATVGVDVRPTNDAPVADDQSVATDEDTAVAITLTGSDVDGDPLTFTVVVGPSNGTLDGAAPNLTYTPGTNFHGADDFMFRVDDETGQSATGSVTIDVRSVNDLPVADDQAVTTDEETAVSITLTGSDADGDPLTFIVSDGPAHGTLSGEAPDLTYTPEAGFSGADSFTFRVRDGNGGTDEATIDLTVGAVNDPPTADAQAVSTVQDTALAITLTGSDPDGDALTFTVSDGPSHGTLTGAEPNVTYTPAAGYSGPDSFSFRVDDGNGAAATAVVEITVSPVEPPPPPTATTSVRGHGSIETATGNGRFDVDVESTGEATTGTTKFRTQDLTFRATDIRAFASGKDETTWSGVGKLDGERGYSFTVWVVDGEGGKRAIDRFRIEIVRTSDGSVVFDSLLSEVRRGSIVVRTT